MASAGQWVVLWRWMEVWSERGNQTPLTARLPLQTAMRLPFVVTKGERRRMDEDGTCIQGLAVCFGVGGVGGMHVAMCGALYRWKVEVRTPI